jgi:hypothetical protein
MSETREEIFEERRKLKLEYGDLFDSIVALLFRNDPIGINFEDNTDEYDPEARTILPRLPTCKSSADVLRVVHEEFTRWFDPQQQGHRNATARLPQRFVTYGRHGNESMSEIAR